MSKPKILIVGCGAVGLCQGYHLSSGADITYLVRPGRRPAFLPPKQLYSYKEDELHTFSSYRVIESVSEVSGEVFALIFDTLDGHTARSEGGVTTLSSVGKLINEPQNTNCFVVFDAIGLDMEEHYARTMRIDRSRLILAASMLAHQPTPQITIPATANKDFISKADILYSHSTPNVGLLVFNTQPVLTQKLGAMYNANGRLTVSVIPAFIAYWAPMLGMLHLVTWNIDGFGPFARLKANRELWNLMLRAQSEILSLPRYGWMGWLLSFVVKGWVTEKMNLPMVESAEPMSYEEFNAFHHGGKVAEQDVRALEDVLSEGEKRGKNMKALSELVDRARKLHSRRDTV